MIRTLPELRIRNLVPADIPTLLAFQPLCFPPPFPADSLWDADDLLAHLRRFPEGQFVAELNNEIVGSASSLIVTEAIWQARVDWTEVVGGSEMENHDPSGTTLFGADLAVAPSAQRRGVGRALYQARFDLAGRLGLTRTATVCRIPDLANHPDLSPEQYADKVARGELTDRTLTPLLKAGMAYVGIAHDFLDDEESRDCGAALERPTQTAVQTR
jgi:ribosomal protein S18 acetylase RimI-like enzyme